MDETTTAGLVTEDLPNDMFRVRLDSGRTVTAHISGADRMRFVRVLPGDRVRVTLSAYDDSRGRIVARLDE